MASCLRAKAREEGQRRAKGSRGAEESDAQSQPLKEPWRKVSPPRSPSVLSSCLSPLHLSTSLSSSLPAARLFTFPSMNINRKHCYCVPHKPRLHVPHSRAMHQMAFNLNALAFFKAGRSEFETAVFVAKMHKHGHKESGLLPEAAGLRSDAEEVAWLRRAELA